MLKFGEQLSSAPAAASAAAPSNTIGASPPLPAAPSIQYAALQQQQPHLQMPQQSSAAPIQLQPPHVYSTLQQQMQQQHQSLDSSQQQLLHTHQRKPPMMHTSSAMDRSPPDLVVPTSKDGANNNVIPVIPEHIQQHVTNREAIAASSSLTPLPSSTSNGSSSSSSSSISSTVHTSPHPPVSSFASSSTSSAAPSTTTTKHKRNNWKNKPKYCQHCNFYFELSQSHCPKCHKITQVKLKCPYCDDRWEYYTKMSTHLKNKHKNQQEPAPEKTTGSTTTSPQTTSTAPTSASASSSTTTSPSQKDVSIQQQQHDSDRATAASSSDQQQQPPDPHALTSAAIILQSALKQSSLQQLHNEKRQTLPTQPQPAAAPAISLPPKMKISTARRNLIHSRNAEPVFKEEQMQPAMLSPMSPIKKKRKTVVRSDTRHSTSSSDTGASAQQSRCHEDAAFDTLLNFDETLNDTSCGYDFPVFDSSPFLSPFNYIALTSLSAPTTSPAYSPSRCSFNYNQIARKLFGPPSDDDMNDMTTMNREYDTDSSTESHEEDTVGRDNRLSLSTSLVDLNLQEPMQEQDFLEVLKPTNLFDRHDFDDDQSMRSRVIIAETPREEERWF